MSGRVAYIIRGLPGSGKTTLAKKLVPEHCHVEVDMFYKKGPVVTRDEIPAAYNWCLEQFEKLCVSGYDQIAVSNIFARLWEYAPYMKAATRNGYSIQIIEVLGPWASTGTVEKQDLERNRNLWEPTTNHRLNPQHFFKDK